MDSSLSEQQVSQLRFYSWGIVAAHKPINSNTIEVYAVETFPFVDGEVTDAILDETYSGTDSASSSFTAQLKTSVSLSANWARVGESNRLTSPDVRRGERVVIWRFADSDHFFWTTLLQDSKLRRLETVVYGFSSNPSVGETTKDDYYFLEVSTHTGLITFHTTNKNGEFCTYDFQINTKTGYATLQDSLGNYLMLNSKETLTKIRNADDSYFEASHGNVTVSCPGTLTLKADKIVSQSAGSTSITAGSDLTAQASSISTASSGAYSATGADVTVSGNTAVTITSPSTSIS